MVMEVLLIIAALTVAVAVYLLLTYVRRSAFSRYGSVAMAARVSQRMPGRGWAPGFAVYESGTLRWYRMFSLALGPRYSLARTDLEVSERREPFGAEAQIFPSDVVILRCKSSRGDIELAMTDSAVTGFLSWLEAAPPGGGLFR